MATAEELLARIDAAKNQSSSPATILGRIDQEIAARQPSGDGLDPLRGAAQRVIDFASNAVTGDDRREFDLPEVPDFMAQQGGLTGSGGMSGNLLGLGRDDLRKLDILRGMIGDVDADLDAYGNVYVTIPDGVNQMVPGGQYYLNRPGLSGQDVNDLGTGALFEGAGVMAGLGAASRFAPGSKLAKIGGGGVGAAAGSAAQDVTAARAGSERGIDPLAALTAGTLGLASEIGGQIVSRFLMRGGAVRGGQLTPQAIQALRNAGLDAEQIANITPEFMAEFQALARRATNVDDMTNAAAVAEAQSLPQPVRLSRGDVTRDVTQQGAEDAMRKGAYGRGAQEQMVPFRIGQNQDLIANRDAIQGSLSGQSAPTVTAPGAGMEVAQEALTAQRANLKAAVDAAYNAAREAPNAAFESDSVRGLVWAIRGDVGQQYGAGLATDGPAMRLLGELDTMVTPREGGRPSVVLVNALEGWRQRVNRAINGNIGTTDAAALISMKNQLDGYVDEAIDGALVQGDAGVIDLFRNARTLRAELGRKFEGNNLLEKIIAVENGDLVKTPQEALNILFTSSGAGGKQGATEALTQVKAILGEGSEAWNALREDAFMRLFRSQDISNTINEANERVLSGPKFSTAFLSAMRDSPELMKTLFSGQELALIDQFRRVAMRATDRVAGAVNTSNSFNAMARAVQQLAGSGIVGRLGTRALQRFILEPMNTGSAAFATAIPMPAVRGLPVGPSTVPGALLAPEVFGVQEIYGPEGRLNRLGSSGQP